MPSWFIQVRMTENAFLYVFMIESPLISFCLSFIAVKMLQTDAILSLNLYFLQKKKRKKYSHIL